AINKGAKLLTGGNITAGKGHFYQPTLLQVGDNSNLQDLRIFNEEIFGPVAAVYRFKSEAEAIKIANDTSYGLASYFYSNDHKQIERVQKSLAYGMVGVNEAVISNAVAPFGGIKHSGIGREGSFLGIKE